MSFSFQRQYRWLRRPFRFGLFWWLGQDSDSNKWRTTSFHALPYLDRSYLTASISEAIDNICCRQLYSYYNVCVQHALCTVLPLSNLYNVPRVFYFLRQYNVPDIFAKPFYEKYRTWDTLCVEYIQILLANICCHPIVMWLQYN